MFYFLRYRSTKFLFACVFLTHHVPLFSDIVRTIFSAFTFFPSPLGRGSITFKKHLHRTYRGATKNSDVCMQARGLSSRQARGVGQASKGHLSSRLFAKRLKNCCHILVVYTSLYPLGMCVRTWFKKASLRLYR